MLKCVTDWTGKIEVRIGGGLVFLFPISSQIMSYDVTFQRHAQYSKTREHLIEYFHKFVLCIHNRPYWAITGPLESLRTLVGSQRQLLRVEFLSFSK